MGEMTVTLMMIASAALTGAAVGLTTWALWPRRLLAEAAEQKAEDEKSSDAARRFLFTKLSPVSSPLLSKKREGILQTRLIMMGAPDLRPVDIVTMQILCTILFGILTAMFLNLFGESLLYTIGGALVGTALPVIWMRDQIQKRHMAIGRAMPFNLDLLTLSVEAGLDFGGATAKVVEKGVAGPLVEELGIMLKEIRMGKTREEALRNLADRVRFPPLTQFVSNLVQAEQMGTSLGKILRIQSSQLRIQRTQRAEKLANEAPVKMLFPLIFCIFPTVFMILFGPIVYQFISGGP